MAELVLTDKTFEEEVLKSDVPVMVDFWAAWCQPCKIVSPIIDEIAHDFAGKVKVGKLNVDENPTSSQNYNIMSIPTLLIFKGGKPVKTVIGARPKEDFKKALDEVLAS